MTVTPDPTAEDAMIVAATQLRNLLLVLIVVVGGGWWGYLEWNTQDQRQAMNFHNDLLTVYREGCADGNRNYCADLKETRKKIASAARSYQAYRGRRNTFLIWLGALLLTPLISIPALRYVKTGRVRKPREASPGEPHQ